MYGEGTAVTSKMNTLLGGGSDSQISAKYFKQSTNVSE